MPGSADATHEEPATDTEQVNSSEPEIAAPSAELVIESLPGSADATHEEPATDTEQVNSSEPVI